MTFVAIKMILSSKDHHKTSDSTLDYNRNRTVMVVLFLLHKNNIGIKELFLVENISLHSHRPGMHVGVGGGGGGDKERRAVTPRSQHDY